MPRLPTERTPGVCGEFAQPLALRGGGSYVPIPTLLAPRSYTLLYAIKAGRTK